MPFKPAPPSRLLRHGVARGGSGDTVDIRDSAAPLFGSEDEAAAERFAPGHGLAFRKHPDPESLAPLGRLLGRHSPFPLILSLAAAFLVIVAICWSLWER